MSGLVARLLMFGTRLPADAKVDFQAQYDFIAQRFARGTTGAGTPTDAELQLARHSLGVGMLNFRNRVLNGDMRIDQRYAGGAIATPASGAYLADRWCYVATQASKFNAQRGTGGPAGSGLNYFMGLTVAATLAVAAGDHLSLRQRIEGVNVADWAFGTAGAKTLTLSFWVRSSMTGNHSGSLRNSAANRSFPFTFNIAVADTWEFKQVQIAGDASGTWLTDTGIGMDLGFNLGAGSTFLGAAGAWAAANYVGVTGAVSPVGTSATTFRVTGVQLEAAASTAGPAASPLATPFEFVDYDTINRLCCRYYETSYPDGVALGANSPLSGRIWAIGDYSYFAAAIQSQFIAKKRAAATMAYYNPVTGTAGSFRVASSNSTGGACTTLLATTDGFAPQDAGAAVSAPGMVSTHWAASAEL